MKQYKSFDGTIRCACESCGRAYKIKEYEEYSYYIDKCPICGKEMCYSCGYKVFDFKPHRTFEYYTDSSDNILICSDCYKKHKQEFVKLQRRYDNQIDTILKQTRQKANEVKDKYKKLISDI